jgi:glycosyltransferase involved in cell wall biosynthesis
LDKQIFICLPVLNESAQLPGLLDSLVSQSFKNFQLICCVNQLDDWWNHKEKLHICEDNQKSIEILKKSDLEIIVIDRSSRGIGWKGKQFGVGWARKKAMDKAADLAKPEDLIVSIDADTFYPADYFQSLSDLFALKTPFTVHSNPYYHPLTGHKAEDEAILRYELYMRVYHINMMLIDNPYAFDALGSAIACTAAQYKKMGGISPKMSGEDFYFIQHMRKNGPVSHYNHVKVYPQARFSNRVYFGTGPAMIKGNLGDWSSYPFYLPIQFKKVGETYAKFGELFEKDLETPMSAFLQTQLKRENLWQSLRRNFKTRNTFQQACMQLVDGLRILQFLKCEKTTYTNGDKEDLLANLTYFAAKKDSFKTSLFSIPMNEDNVLSFAIMKELRNALEKLEIILRFEKPII